MKIPNDLRAFVELLNAAGAKYLVVGGYAVAFHGHPRFTGDIDLFIEPSADNSRVLSTVLDDFGFGELNIGSADFVREDMILQLGLPPNRIDIMTSIDGVSFSQAWPKRVSAVIDGLEMVFISRELLIQNKLASGRAKDVADAEELSRPD